MTQRILLIQLTPENANAIGNRLVAYQNEIVEQLNRDMTVEQAQLVKGWRADGYTWGKIGQLWVSHHDGETPWSPDSILGKNLCIRAAELLGEDPWSEAWN